uniref:(northern house mosquito) hypothetical protein n=1 Tax=Culex pipiens TaxID=7175 RepID=A0A8D8GTY2_CULPI
MPRRCSATRRFRFSWYQGKVQKSLSFRLLQIPKNVFPHREKQKRRLISDPKSRGQFRRPGQWSEGSLFAFAPELYRHHPVSNLPTVPEHPGPQPDDGTRFSSLGTFFLC